ncbi:MAG TPA: trypsin-like serine protease [Azospirillaceae bacterium]|nr:trypsin-like serine protease [Azospirillaceae bacterium]
MVAFASLDGRPVEASREAVSWTDTGVVHIQATAAPVDYSGTGTLLYSGRHVLTAAHIAENMAIGDIVAFHTADGQSVFTVPVGSVTLHPGWSRTTAEDDIAILTLATEAPTWAIRHDINRNGGEIGQMFKITGYGVAGNGQGEYPDDPFFPTKREGLNRYDAISEDGELLFYDFDSGNAANDAGALLNAPDLGLGPREANATRGDSGGPGLLLSDDGTHVLSGVVSHGLSGLRTDIDPEPDSSFGELTAETRVSAYADWIDTLVQGSATVAAPAPAPAAPAEPLAFVPASEDWMAPGRELGGEWM